MRTGASRYPPLHQRNRISKGESTETTYLHDSKEVPKPSALTRELACLPQVQAVLEPAQRLWRVRKIPTGIWDRIPSGNAKSVTWSHTFCFGKGLAPRCLLAMVRTAVLQGS